MNDDQGSRASEEHTIINQDTTESHIESPSSSPLSIQNEDIHGSLFEGLSSSLPPTAQELDFQFCHIGLKQFGEGLQVAAKNLFPNDSTSRYTKKSVLILSWQDEDPKLLVSTECQRLSDVFEHIYGCNVESWKIPTKHSHFELNQKIGAFVRPEDDDRQHLKIVYYAGHSRLAANRTLVWAGRPKVRGTPPSTLTWSGIQTLLEQAQSDVLILLDCCCSGTANTGEGNGVTELIAACGYNNKALGVGPYSFSSALIMELQKLSWRPSFSIGELYSNIYLNIQHRTLIDGTELHPPPIHLSLTQEAHFPRSIQLSATCKLLGTNTSTATDSGNLLSSQASHSVIGGSTLSNTDKSPSHSTPPIPKTESLSQCSSELIRACPDSMAPRICFAIRLKDTFHPGDLCEDLFQEWLKLVPALVDEVKVEAGFGSFSSLLIISVPISLSIYISRDPAVNCLGPITTSNLISGLSSNGNSKREIVREDRPLAGDSNTPRLLPLAIGDSIEASLGLLDKHLPNFFGKTKAMPSEKEISASGGKLIPPAPRHNTLKGHTDSVSAIAFSPDRKLLASASYDQTVKIWDLATGIALYTLKGHTYLVSAVMFSPDGKLVASASYDRKIKLWDLATREARFTLEGHADWVTAVAFLPDGKLLASASSDRTIKLWDSTTGKLCRKLEGHEYWVTAIAFSLDGKLIASAAHDRSVRLWDLATGEVLRTLEGHADWVTAIAFSPNGMLIASASYDKTIRFWDSATGVPKMHTKLEANPGSVLAVAFSQDRAFVVSSSHNKTIRLWEGNLSPPTVLHP